MYAEPYGGYSYELVNESSDLPGKDQLKASASVYMASLKYGRLRESLDCLAARPGVLSIEISQDHVMSYVGLSALGLFWVQSVQSCVPHYVYSLVIGRERKGGEFGWA